jgi:Ser/Thr protein kinase RdoA (MazF antagonist)
MPIPTRSPLPPGDPAARRYDGAADGDGTEVRLTAGNLTDGVARIGGTVRRPHLPQSTAVADYLDHLQRAGFPGAPRYLGRDGDGRDVLTYLDGDVPGDPLPAWAADDGLLASVGELLRRLHEASAGYAAGRGFRAAPGTRWRRDLVTIKLPHPDPVPELVSHLDVTPRNTVVRDGRAVAFIDFDLAGPTTHLLNTYNTAVHWVPLCPPDELPPAWRGIDQPRRLRIFTEAYGLSAAQRTALPDLGIARADLSWLRMRASAEQLGGGWARMWANGAGDAIRRRQAWLADSRSELLAALR